MRRLLALVSASALLATLLLVPMASGASAAIFSFAGFPCSPHGSTAGSPMTTLSGANVDTATPANSRLSCLFRGTRMPASFGGTCSFQNATYHVDFTRRTLLPVNGNTNLICSGATTVSLNTDLQISKADGGPTADPGGTTTYTIVVMNAGPSAVTGATVTDTFPAAITGATYTSVAAGGATGNTAAGSGNIADSLNLPVNASVTYTVVATISASATGNLVNTASVTAPAGIFDTNPANNTATDTDALTVDLAVTLTDGVTTVTGGQTTTYTLTVTNNGPRTATNVGFGFSVTCPGCVGLTINLTGLNPPIPNLAPGATAVRTLAITPGLASSGTLTINANVSSPEIDSNPANNNVTDVDTVVPGP